MKNLSNREKWLVAFVAVAMALCLTPLVGMIFAPTTQTTENKKLAPLPELVQDGEINTGYLGQLGDYYADHFAFRPQLVSADAALRGRIFGVSTVDTVTVGRDGWLFYTDTLGDYSGTAQMSDRQLFNIANNLAITQRYVKSRGADFIFTIAPNKNTLYPEYMPRVMQAADIGTHNAVRLAPELEEACVSYSDLFALFGSTDEVYYLARDSHWNNDGARLAAEYLLDAAGRGEVSFTDVPRSENEDYIGDLNSMLYPLNAIPETNAEYALSGFEITNGAEAADAPIIVTSASDAAGSLLMQRDSFGNTLYPFMAEAYGSACFVRTMPLNLSMYMDIYAPDTVIIEKVERSIDELAQMPPVLETPDTQLLLMGDIITETTVNASEAMENMMFWRLDGTVEPGLMDERSRVFLKVTLDDGFSFVREAFTVSGDSGDSGFVMYLSKDSVWGEQATAEVIVAIGGLYTVVGSTEIYWSEIPPAFEE